MSVHAAEFEGTEGVRCDCCGEDCTGIENHDLISFNDGTEEVLCNGCIEHELGEVSR